MHAVRKVHFIQGKTYCFKSVQCTRQYYFY